ncbi:MAG: DUF1365 domain-containing protein [Acidimicrobiia bacterium]|nr:DUF1365 domain-containing protein [Acidimicrobiia bacterium]
MTDLLGPTTASPDVAQTRPLTPDLAAVCSGTVQHERARPTVHRFERPVTMIWIDPDRPDDLFGRHALWSAHRRAPVRFDRSDYGAPFDDRSLALQARCDLAPLVGDAPVGPVRMLTQPRSYGWLFNPLTLYFVWGRDATSDPVGVVAEVSNTPWKERHRYPVALDGSLESSFEKVMHVSPFLGLGMRYDLRIAASRNRLQIAVDVVEHEAESDASDVPILRTFLDLGREPGTTRVLSRAMLRQPFPTHRVSAAIHVEAAKLWAKGVPLVAHPRRAFTRLDPVVADDRSRS